jgi:hypothetical protein
MAQRIGGKVLTKPTRKGVAEKGAKGRENLGFVTHERKRGGGISSGAYVPPSAHQYASIC